QSGLADFANGQVLSFVPGIAETRLPVPHLEVIGDIPHFATQPDVEELVPVSEFFTSGPGVVNRPKPNPRKHRETRSVRKEARNSRVCDRERIKRVDDWHTDAERTESDVGTWDVERIRFKWHCCQRRIEKRSCNFEIPKHREVFVAQIASERPIVHLTICRRQRRRESRKIKFKISPIQRVRVTKEPNVELRWVLIERRSRGTRRRMRKRRVHTRLRTPATTKKHSRPQGEISNVARNVQATDVARNVQAT